MAVRLATVADYLRRSSGIIQGSTTTQTRMVWARSTVASTPPAYQAILLATIDNPSTFATYAELLLGNPVNTDVALDVNGTARAATAPTVNTWNHYCWVQSGTTHWFFLNGIQQGASITVNTAALVFNFELCGGDTFSDGNIDVAYVREWTVDLTAAQILAEMGASQAANLTSLFLDTPLVSDLLDDSGNGHTWTQVGSGSFVAGPDLPANNTAFTATALTTSDAFTVDMGQGTTAWFSYTPSSVTEVVLGFWALYDYAKVTQMLISVYSGSPSALTLWPNTTNGIDGSTSVPYQIPVTPGVTVYIKIYMHLASQLPFTSDIAISTLPGPAADIAVGSIAVNDDLDGFPIAMMDNATGEPTAFLNFQASNSGAVMPVTGEVLVDTGSSSSGATEFRLYQSDYQTFTTIPYPTNTSATGPFVVGSDGSSLFYVTSSNDAVRQRIVTTYDTSGTLISSFDVGAFSIRGGCPNHDNTIFYFVVAGANQPIKRWDIVGGALLADLPTGVANYASVPDLLVLGDETIIWAGHRGGFADLVKQFSAAGALLNTYTMEASPRTIDHLATAIDDPNSFWVWMHNNDADAFDSTFLNIEASTGTLLVDTDAQIFEQGQYGGDFTVAPNARFGHSNSCPFWIVRVGVTPPTPGPGEPEEFIIRRERWFPVINQENQRMTYSMLQVDLQAGNGLTTGQGSEPLLELDWSDDAGWTWSNIRFLPTGRIGQYNRRAIARVLGQSRQRVFRIAVSDPVQWVILDGYMQVKGGTS